MNSGLKKNSGISSVEILVSLTILLVLMLGLNAVIFAKAKMNITNKDFVMANTLSEKLLHNVIQESNTPESFVNLKNTETNLSNLNISGFEKSELEKFVGVITIESNLAKTIKNTNSGNNIVIFIDKPPSKIGIFDNSSAIIYNMIAKSKEIVMIKTYNDSSMNFIINDTTALKRGRQGLTNSFPAGSYVIGADMAVKTEIFYASKDNKNIRDYNRKPISSSATILSFPFER